MKNSKHLSLVLALLLKILFPFRGKLLPRSSKFVYHCLSKPSEKKILSFIALLKVVPELSLIVFAWVVLAPIVDQSWCPWCTTSFEWQNLDLMLSPEARDVVLPTQISWIKNRKRWIFQGKSKCR